MTGKLIPVTYGDGFHAWTGADGFAGTAQGGARARWSFPKSHSFGFPPATVCPCTPLGLCMWAFAGPMDPAMGQGVAQQRITWAPPPAVVSLGSFVGVLMSFITKPSRYNLVLA